MGAPPPSQQHQRRSRTQASPSVTTSRVRVVTRIRPLSTVDQQNGVKPAVTALTAPQSPPQQQQLPTLVQVDGAGSESKRWFEVDAVLDTTCSQAQVYVDSGAQAAVTRDLFQGYNCTILAYGQTGAGKTYTMGTSSGANSTDDDRGILPRACADVFAQIDTQCDGHARVTLSYLEVYQEQLRDLLADEKSNNNTPLRIRETASGQVVVTGAVTAVVDSCDDVTALLRRAATRRVTAATAANAVSSRSHALLTLHIEGQRRTPLANDNEENETQFTSKLTLVDLAGSERIKQTGATGTRQSEGITINKSLLVLGQVVAALASEQQSSATKPPYRDSKLTRLLQDSLGGNCRTLLLACVAPTVVEESIQTLRYATRARQIRHTVTRNVVGAARTMSPAQVAELQRDNAVLRNQVAHLQETIRQLTQSSSASCVATTPASQSSSALSGTSPSSASSLWDASGSPTQTMSTATCSDDDADEDHDDERSRDGFAEPGTAKQEGVFRDETHITPASTPKGPSVAATDDDDDDATMTTTTTTTDQAVDKLPTEVGEYWMQISNLKVEVAQLKGDLLEHQGMAKKYAALQVHLAEAQAEADAARTAAVYMSDIVDELRGLKHDDLARKQWVLQLKLKEQNMFSLVQAMLETYRMQLRKLGLDFDKTIVRVVEDNLGASMEQSWSRRPPALSEEFLQNDADGQSVGSFGETSLSKFGLRSVGMETVAPSPSHGTVPHLRYSSSHKRDGRNPIWWGSRHNQQGQKQQQQNSFVQPWKQATLSFQSQIRDIEAGIGSDVESLLSNMKQLAEEAQALESEIGREELSSEYLLRSTDDTQSELVDHLSSILLMKEAAPLPTTPAETS